MEKTETIDFQHRQLILEKFRELNLPISDYTFANVYLFRNISRYEFLTTDCGLFIASSNRQGQRCIMPLNDLRQCELATFKNILDKQNSFFPIPEEWLSHFSEDEFLMTYDEGDSDYIYLTENMASFKGRQYTRHRNHLNQFHSLYAPQAESLTKHNTLQAKAILQDWQDESKLGINNTDFEQCLEALELIEELALWGTIYYIENEPAGFIIGEPLNTDTFGLHFAKASKKYHGIYEFMFNDSAKRLVTQYKYLNLEEDMGNKNLGRTKASYGPEKLLKKYRVHLK
jgi:uncharacterized protein